MPLEIADAFNVLRAGRLQYHCRILFLALLLTVPTAIYGASANASWWVRYIIPLAAGAVFLAGFLSLNRMEPGRITARGARKFLREATWSSSIIAVPCSMWCVISWWTAPVELRAYYPLIVSMGSLATAYCLSSVRLAAILNMAIGLFPISLLMLFSGNRMDFAASVSLLIAGGFLLRMVFEQHDQWVQLLLLQSEMRVLADTDPLTGLLNRRALDERVQEELHKATKALDKDPKTAYRFSIALLDLDGFKLINDRFGHAVGDRLLCETGRRLREACGDTAIVARQGGDEFAMIFPNLEGRPEHDMAGYILAALARPCQIDGHPIRFGASIGIAHWPENGATIEQLFETADRALYSAKAALGADSLQIRDVSNQGRSLAPTSRQNRSRRRVTNAAS